MAGGANANTIRTTQLGIQTAFGIGSIANVLLTGVGADVKPVVASVMLSEHNSKIDVSQVATKGSMTTGKLTGWAGYNDLAYIFSMLLKAATITTPGGATNARDWTWTMLKRTAETPKWATFEGGIAGLDVSRFSDGSLTGLKLGFEKNRECSVDGDLIGTLLAEEGVTATPTPTEILSVPISVNLMDAYVADTIGGLSAGLLGAMYKYDWTLSNRRNPTFPIRSDKPSFGGTVETKNTCMSHVEVENDAQSYAMMSQMRQSNTRYFRSLVTGPQIEPGFNYEFEVTHAFKVMNPDRGPMDEVYGGMYDLMAVNDSTLGGFCKVRLRCKLTALIAGVNLDPAAEAAAIIAAISAPGFS